MRPRKYSSPGVKEVKESDLDKYPHAEYLRFIRLSRNKPSRYYVRLRTPEEITEYNNLKSIEMAKATNLISLNDYVWVRKDDDYNGRYGQVEAINGETYIVMFSGSDEGHEYTADELELDDLPF